VLKGHIDLAMAVFPKGTCGPHLDILAREPLWRYKRNFGHGTGHGVGFFLGVHEGPHEFRQNFNSVPFQAGFVVTDEPGIYREGMHGVRHENVLLCRSLGDNEFGSWLGFEPLTLCHYDTSCLELSLLTEDERNWLNAYNERVYKTLSPRLPAEVAAWLRNKTLPV
jgi:Xaa-Pro aminopeptidase